MASQLFDELHLFEQVVTLQEVTQVGIALVGGELVQISGTCEAMKKYPTIISSYSQKERRE